ncbi:MAG: class II aldolase/adducin family protein [Candidatus Thermoplasmatota archaeon]|nr:class II aldolase/adducin family protein [Candidatus Thermoplasmatota archaeon]
MNPDSVSTPARGPPSKPPSGPPQNLPATEDKPKPPTGPPPGPPSSKPRGPPSKPPSGPPQNIPSVDGEAKPPTGPPSGPPTGKPSGPPSGPPGGTPDESSETKIEEVEASTETEQTSDLPTIADNEVVTDEQIDVELAENAENSDVVADAPQTTENSDSETSDDSEEEGIEQIPDEKIIPSEEVLIDQEEDISVKEAEIARLSAEVERLRSSMSGAADIIEEMENPPMPPVVHEDLVIGAHIVADMARMARQLDRDKLVRASMGTIAMLHPDRLDVLISTKNKSLLPRMNEQDLCAGKLNADPPRGAPTDWRVLEVLLASTSIVTGGPAAVIHCHGAYSTAVSCEKDLVLMQPIDEIGKDSIGKVIIVDPDEENPREYLRQVAEALNQGGMRCVVIRGNGAYAVGADLDQAWANAAMLEHSMKIVMLARQANLKI